MRYIIVLFVCTFLAALSASAQTQTEREKINELEKGKENQRAKFVRDQLDSAILLTNAGNYQLADEKYKYVLKNLRSLPSDLTYHFGRNSYLLGNYSQSVDG